MPSELKIFHTRKLLIIEKEKLPSVVNERLGERDVGIYVYHMSSFIIIMSFLILVCILMRLFIIGYVMSKLSILIAVNNSVSLVCD